MTVPSKVDVDAATRETLAGLALSLSLIHI